MTTRYLAIGRQQTQNRRGDRALSTARFSYNPYNLALLYLKTHVPYGGKGPIAGKISNMEVFDAQNGVHQALHNPENRGSSTSRRVSPKSVNPKVVSINVKPAQVIGQGELRIKLNPSDKIAPHDGVGGGTPKPRKDNPASKVITTGISIANNMTN